MFPKLLEIKALPNYTLWLRYDDETVGTVDLSYHVGRGQFKDWDNKNPFETVHLVRRGIITWNEDLDICPDSMYLKIRNLSFEDYNKESLSYATN